MKKYAIVIPSKTISNLQVCLEAIRCSGSLAPIFVVWDGPIEPTLEENGAQIPDGVLFVKGAEPFVFARNVNLGIAAAGELDVILMNDDAIVQVPNGLTKMAMACSEPGAERFGVVSAVVAGMAAAPDQQFSRALSELGLKSPRMIMPVVHHMLAFICVYIRRAMLDAIGPLDERFVGYGYDDDDYCRRVRDAGFQLGVAPGCIVEHQSLPSTFRGQGAAAPAGMMEANRALYLEKWGEQ